MHQIYIGIAWCLAWGEGRKPQHDLEILNQMREALINGEEENIPTEVKAVVEQVRELENIDKNYIPETLAELKERYSQLWEQNIKIGLIYGGVTKVKQYVFEAAKLPDIRGASALLDRINLVDLKAFFGIVPESDIFNYSAQCSGVRNWLNENFSKKSNDEPKFTDALIPELIIYSTGGNILAFCPAAFVDDLANAIEKRYTHETLTANSCAVGDCFKLLEIRFGLLRDNIEETFWLDKYQEEYEHPIVEACFGKVTKDSPILENFQNHKSFNELTTKLAVQFNQRRSGNNTENRPTRRYPPMFETHPYLIRDAVDKRSAIAQITELTGKPFLSESAIRKRCIGDRAKKEERVPPWYQKIGLDWQPGIIDSWTNKFETFLKDNSEKYERYCKNYNLDDVKLSQSLTELSEVSNGYVAYIYADGNNMGGYIQKIRTPKEYQNFSDDVDKATRYSVYQALSEHLHPRKLKDGKLIHPFEIITIGGDDIIIIVPGDKALEIAKIIGEQFEKILLEEVKLKNVEIKDCYRIKSPDKPVELNKIHRYSAESAEASQCKLSMSSGVLITSHSTPVYYAEKLTSQLLKSAKKRGKNLKKVGYFGGTVDFLTLKSVTMISSNIEEFRQKALVKERSVKLKLYAAPYTLHELGGLIKSVQALKKAEFPRSQIYQIRSLLERGKQTAILNYRYFRVRLKPENSELLTKDFEAVWCKAKTNGGNLAPWMYNTGEIENSQSPDPFYETIWRELVDIYDFVSKDDETESNEQKNITVETNS